MAETHDDLNRFQHDVATWRRAMLDELQKLDEKDLWHPLGFDVPKIGSSHDPALEREVSALLIEKMQREIVRAPFKLQWELARGRLYRLTVVLTIETAVLAVLTALTAIVFYVKF